MPKSARPPRRTRRPDGAAASAVSGAQRRNLDPETPQNSKSISIHGAVNPASLAAPADLAKFLQVSNKAAPTVLDDDEIDPGLLGNVPVETWLKLLAGKIYHQPWNEPRIQPKYQYSFENMFRKAIWQPAASTRIYQTNNASYRPGGSNTFNYDGNGFTWH